MTLLLYFGQEVHGQQTSPLWGELARGKFGVGYKTLDEKDGSRSFPKKNGTTFTLGSREIRVSLWYPMQIAAKQKMKFRDYLSAMENGASEAEKFESTTKLKTIAVARELSEKAVSNLLEMPTAAIKDAPFLKGAKFPLVLLGQGLFYESPTTHTILCEFLASHGFIVATTELNGAHSPFVKLDAVDLEAAVRDLEFVASRAQSLPNADQEKLGIVGFDWAGLPG